MTGNVVGSMLDQLANAITPSLLRPYVAPQRPLLLGSIDTLCVRAGYVARDPSDVPRINGTVHVATRALAASIAAQTGRTLRDDIDWTVPEATALDDAQPSALVLICDDVLQRLDDPTPLLRRLKARLDQSAIIVLAAPVRALTVGGDAPGPPAVLAHVREWTFPELQALLDASGLDAVFGGILPSSAPDTEPVRAAFVLVGATPSTE